MSNNEQNERVKYVADSIIRKIHAAGGNAALDTFMRTKGAELPSVQLTACELELLGRGGWWSFVTSLFERSAAAMPDLPYCVQKYALHAAR